MRTCFVRRCHYAACNSASQRPQQLCSSRGPEQRRRHAATTTRHAEERQGEPEVGLPGELLRRRQLKQAGLALSTASLAAGAVAAAAAGMSPPAEVVQLTALTLFAVPASLAAAKFALGESLHIEWHDGRLHLSYAANDPSQPPALVEVRPTSDGRGNGAFAAADIARGTYIGDYEGELLSELEYWALYPSGVSDYSIRVDSEWTIDGAERATDSSAFSACHMNHASGGGSNVARRTLCRQQIVRFFAKRDIKAGEELLLDYGSVYWTGRENLIIQ